MKPELEIWIELHPGTAVRVRMAVVEDGLPSPGEPERARQPYLGEIHQAARAITHERLCLERPF